MRRYKGFTIVELLVVAAIICILATTMFVSYNSSQTKTRDAKRVEEINLIARTVRMFYANEKKWPQAGLGVVATPANFCYFPETGLPSEANQYKNATVPCLGGETDEDEEDDKGLVSEGYLTTLPTDPRQDFTDEANAYYYAYQVNIDGAAAYVSSRLENLTPSSISGNFTEGDLVCQAARYCIKLVP